MPVTTPAPATHRHKPFALVDPCVISGDAPREIESFFKRSHKVIVALTVKEILGEQIAKKLV
ncbi:MAG TPA: hypothetical protein VNU95_15845 [Candidatus Acidoferrales bacterium]|nr:hypothetical protein [Candidatus Acidoferrales bacterium]